MKKLNGTRKIVSILIGVSLLGTSAHGLGQSFKKDNQSNASEASSMRNDVVANKDISAKEFTFKAIPETFEVSMTVDGKTETVSKAGTKRKVEGFICNIESATWVYPNEKMAVSIVKEKEALNVTVRALDNLDKAVTWPLVEAQAYMMPFGEGKYFNAKDQVWKTQLETQGNLEILESYSMGFFGAEQKAFGLTYVFEQLAHTSVAFDTKTTIGMRYSHEFTSIEKNKDYTVRVYASDNNPVQMAKLYKKDLVQRGKFTTLKEKMKANPNIAKLFGAPHIYVWDRAMPVSFLDDLKKNGIDHAWMGYDDWQNGIENPKFVKKASEMGYLIGTYDSYHSIHKPGEEQWETAKFEDKTLYDQATVIKKNGKYATGFSGKGRKLNPTLAMDAVKSRMSKILSTGVAFNTWFIDCDATGEVLDDYSPQHTTTKVEDLKARLERMAYIRDQKNMVIGSEGGNDYASQTIAFAHGIELPAFSWADPDMSKNKKSPYYLGAYYSPYGGVPRVFGQETLLKPVFKTLYLDACYDLPLYKLVYNDSVITTYQWAWSTFKVKDETQNRMLREVLYNVPPLYHLDQKVWKTQKKAIIAHQKVWGAFSKLAIQEEMTDFKALSADRRVQMTAYGKDLKVIANFGNEPFEWQGQKIKGHSLMIVNKGKMTKYNATL